MGSEVAGGRMSYFMDAVISLIDAALWFAAPRIEDVDAESCIWECYK